MQAVERQLRPLLVRGAVERGHFFQSSSSGVARTADFYANSSVNTALDALRLSVTKADDIRARADAEAFKVYDVMAKNAVRYAVYCEFSDDRGLRETNESARQVIESTGAKRPNRYRGGRRHNEWQVRLSVRGTEYIIPS